MTGESWEMAEEHNPPNRYLFTLCVQRARLLTFGNLITATSFVGTIPLRIRLKINTQ